MFKVNEIKKEMNSLLSGTYDNLQITDDNLKCTATYNDVKEFLRDFHFLKNITEESHLAYFIAGYICLNSKNVSIKPINIDFNFSLNEINKLKELKWNSINLTNGTPAKYIIIYNKILLEDSTNGNFYFISESESFLFSCSIKDISKHCVIN